MRGGPEPGPKPPSRFRPKLPSQRRVGEWSWHENPFVGTQPYRGLLVLMRILNNWDLLDRNTAIFDSWARSQFACSAGHARRDLRWLVACAAKLVAVDRQLAEQHYAEHREKPFFGELVEFITSAPTMALVLEGEGAIPVVRTTMGATNPANAAPGTIRGDFALSMPDNLVHGSDSPESAAREIGLWFGDDELV